MQHCHEVDCFTEVVVTLRWLYLKLEPGLDSSKLKFGLGLDGTGLRIGRCWTCYPVQRCDHRGVH